MKEQQLAATVVDPVWKTRARRRAIERRLYATGPSADGYPLNSYPKRLQRQRELALWLWDREFDLLVTINSNDARCDYERGRSALKKFDALVDRYLLGKNWSKFPSNLRTFLFIVPEHAAGELHYHILVKLPPNARRNPGRAQKLIPFVRRNLQRKRIFPRGDLQVNRLSGRNEINDSECQIDTACYVVKGLSNSTEWENCIISTEFHPSHSSK